MRMRYIVVCIVYGCECCALTFFCSKQKTAYEMRISDWSSDVCSSYLLPCRSTSGNKENSVRTRHVMLLLAGLLLASTAQAADTDAWKLPIATKTLDNGLTVVVSEDHSAPVVGVSVVYHVGMRLEPRDRTGFAHLFEHLMFEGTPNAPEGTFDRVITGGGGRNNGSTRPDFTNYIETAPVSAL